MPLVDAPLIGLRSISLDQVTAAYDQAPTPNPNPNPIIAVTAAGC